MSKGKAPVVEEFEPGLSTSQMRAWTPRKELVSQTNSFSHVSYELLYFILILNWAGEWSDHSPQRRNLGLPGTEQITQRAKASPSLCLSLLPTDSLKRLLCFLYKESRKTTNRQLATHMVPVGSLSKRQHHRSTVTPQM